MTTTRSATAIDAEGLVKTFRTRNTPAVHAITQVSFSVPDGQIVGVVGGPDAGKTTLLKLIAGQLRPTTGHTNLFGYDVIREAMEARNLVRLVSVGAPARDARAIPVRPEARILLVDEPPARLDESDDRRCLATLADFSRGQHKTIVIATRRLGVAREFCDRILMLERGQLILDRRTSDPCWPKLTDVYRITVGGQLDAEWSDWFDGMRIDANGTGTTSLIGPVPDQAALHGLLTKVRDLGLPLIALSRVEPDARDVLDLWRRSGGRFDEAERPCHNGRLG
jgi:ABC-type multidrug transport system ATPase subunit